MSTSGSGGNIITNTLSSIGSFFGLGDFMSVDNSWRARFGESILSDENDRRLRMEKEAKYQAAQVQAARSYFTNDRANINRAIAASGGRPLDPSVVPDVRAAHAPKESIHQQVGVPFRA